jgi:hypothetical protein
VGKGAGLAGANRWGCLSGLVLGEVLARLEQVGLPAWWAGCWPVRSR